MFTRSTLTLAAVTALTIPALAVPAGAETVVDVDVDTVGDMVTFDEEDAVVLLPERTLGDVRSTTLRHRARSVAVRVDLVDLKKKAGGRYKGVAIFMRTNEGVRRNVSLDAWKGHRSGVSDMDDGRSRDVTCTVRHSIDYDANVIEVSFPRGCAKKPRWVRFRVISYAQGDAGYFIDDALGDDPMDSQDSADLVRSERVHRETS